MRILTHYTRSKPIFPSMQAIPRCAVRGAFQSLKALVVARVGLMTCGVLAQLDTLHVLPLLHSRNNAQIEDHWLYISTPSQEEVIVEIAQGEGLKGDVAVA